MNKKTGIYKFIKGFYYAFNGIKKCLSERNMKFHIFAMICVIVAGIIFNISKYDWIICIILFGIVISAEMFNTAIENVVDMITKEECEKAKIAKDVAAGAVLIQAISAAIIGIIIFIPRIIELF